MFTHWPHYFFFQGASLEEASGFGPWVTERSRLRQFLPQEGQCGADSSPHTGSQVNGKRKLLNILLWCLFIGPFVLSLSQKLKSHVDLFVAAKPWVHTVRYGGSIGSRCGGWSRNWRPRWRVDTARAELRKLQRKPWSGGGKRLFYKTSWHPYLNHISYTYKYDEYSFLLLSTLY